ncbi:FAD-dependent oxidoreductase [Paenibacillus rhizoplanae]
MPARGDRKLQAYNFRMCLTDNPDNRMMIGKPEGYNEADYEILFRAIEQGQRSRFFKLNRVTADKTDSNNNSGISTDYNGMNHSYPEAEYAAREKDMGGPPYLPAGGMSGRSRTIRGCRRRSGKPTSRGACRSMSSGTAATGLPSSTSGSPAE